MTIADPIRNLQHIAVRNLIETALIGYLAVLVHSSLIPYDWVNFGSGGKQIVPWSMVVARVAMADILSNVFLYIPVGVLGFWTLMRRIRITWAALLLVIAAGTLLSIAIEWIQAYSQIRVSSIMDVVSNTLGMVVGVLVAVVGRSLFPPLAKAALREFREDARRALLKTYCILLVALASIPFSFTFDLGLLVRAARSSTFVPFDEFSRITAWALRAYETGNEHVLAMASYLKMGAVAGWAAEFASFVIFAWIAIEVFRGVYGFRRWGAIGLTAWTALFFSVGLSVVQFFVVAQGFHATDIVMRMGGAVCGMAVRLSWDARYADRPPCEKKPAIRFARFACLVTTAYILFTGLMPFIVEADSGGILRAVAAEDFLPFNSYFNGRFDLAARDMMGKSVSYLIFGALFAAASRASGTRSPAARGFLIVGVATTMSAVIEFVQIYLVVRVPSLTDPIIAACGCGMGVLVHSRATAAYRLAVAGESPRTAIGSQEVPHPSLTDRLISELAEPRVGAPREPVRRESQRMNEA